MQPLSLLENAEYLNLLTAPSAAAIYAPSRHTIVPCVLSREEDYTLHVKTLLKYMGPINCLSAHVEPFIMYRMYAAGMEHCLDDA